MNNPLEASFTLLNPGHKLELAHARHDASLINANVEPKRHGDNQLRNQRRYGLAIVTYYTIWMDYGAEQFLKHAMVITMC